MFANAFQSGFISIFYSVGSAPLSIWNKEVKNGHIRRVVDEEVKSIVLEISGTNVATTYITCPQKPRASLAIKLPFLVMIIKNMKKYFTFEIQILDDKDIRRRFRVSNFQSTTKVRPFCTTMPIGLSDGWNQVQFNLADFTKRAYGSTYLETVRVQVHANVRIRRIYFSDTLYSEDEMPNEFRLFLPTSVTKPKPKAKVTEVNFIGTCLRYHLLGKIEKKGVEKAPPEEEVPSGAPPSPVEEVPIATEGAVPLIEDAIVEEKVPSVVSDDLEQPVFEREGDQKSTGEEVPTIAEKENEVQKEAETTVQETQSAGDAQVETNVAEEITEGEVPKVEEKPSDSKSEAPPVEGGATELTTEVVVEPPPPSEEASLLAEEIPEGADPEEAQSPPPEVE